MILLSLGDCDLFFQLEALTGHLISHGICYDIGTYRKWLNLRRNCQRQRHLGVGPMRSNASRLYVLYQLKLSAVCSSYFIISCHVHKVKRIIVAAFVYNLLMGKTHRLYIEYNCFAWCKDIASLFIYTISGGREGFDKSAKGGVKLCLIPDRQV